jgi:hypothetical protein
MRKLLRAIARANLKNAEYTRINKKGSDGKSFFSRHWREWAAKTVRKKKNYATIARGNQKRRSA